MKFQELLKILWFSKLPLFPLREPGSLILAQVTKANFNLNLGTENFYFLLSVSFLLLSKQPQFILLLNTKFCNGLKREAVPTAQVIL